MLFRSTHRKHLPQNELQSFLKSTGSITNFDAATATAIVIVIVVVVVTVPAAKAAGGKLFGRLQAAVQ